MNIAFILAKLTIIRKCISFWWVFGIHYKIVPQFLNNLVPTVSYEAGISSTNLLRLGNGSHTKLFHPTWGVWWGRISCSRPSVQQCNNTRCDSWRGTWKSWRPYSVFCWIKGSAWSSVAGRNKRRRRLAGSMNDYCNWGGKRDRIKELVL